MSAFFSKIWPYRFGRSPKVRIEFFTSSLYFILYLSYDSQGRKSYRATFFSHRHSIEKALADAQDVSVPQHLRGPLHLRVEKPVFIVSGDFPPDVVPDRLQRLGGFQAVEVSGERGFGRGTNLELTNRLRIDPGLPSPKLVRAASISTPMMYSTFSTIFKALRADMPPMDTWSSCAAEVEIESTEAGWA